MNSSFNSQIFIEKLSKLNASQQSIETLSHWCIFHRNKAKQVVDTWEQQFHSAPREQRIAFLYLANDILQNSRRKGVEFIAEFWRVLPAALTDVLRKGGENGHNTVRRLLDIWNERKVFGSRGQALKEELFGRNSDTPSEDAKGIAYKLKQPAKEMLEKLTASYEHIYNLPLDEDTLYEKCQTAVNFVDKMEREYGNNSIQGENITSEGARDLETQQRVLRECIENLKASKLSRNNLLTHLKEAMDEQLMKLQQVDSQLQMTQSRYDQVGKILGHTSVPTSVEPTLTLTPTANVDVPANLRDQTLDTPTASADDRKSAAAAVAARLAASTCSAEVLSLVFSSLASSETQKQSAPDAKRPKYDPSVSAPASYVPQPVAPPLPQSQPEPVPPPPPFPPSPTKEDGNAQTLPPATIPLQPVMMPMPGGVVPYGYGSVGPSPPFPLPDYTVLAQAPFVGGSGLYQGLHGPAEGGLFGAPQAPFTPTPPSLSRP